MFRYWIKILQLNESSVVKHVYMMLKYDADQGRTYMYNNKNLGVSNKIVARKSWIIKLMAKSRILDNRRIPDKTRLLDQYHQSWYSAINNSQRLLFYSRYKHTFNFESYLGTSHERKC